MFGTQHRADGSGILHGIADIGPAVHPGKHQIRRGFPEPPGQRIEHTVRRRTGDCIAPVTLLIHPQRIMNGDALAGAATIMLRRHHPDLLGQVAGDLLEHFQAWRVDAVIIGD